MGMGMGMYVRDGMACHVMSYHGILLLHTSGLTFVHKFPSESKHVIVNSAGVPTSAMRQDGRWEIGDGIGAEHM